MDQLSNEMSTLDPDFNVIFILKKIITVTEFTLKIVFHVWKSWWYPFSTYSGSFLINLKIVDSYRGMVDIPVFHF